MSQKTDTVGLIVGGSMAAGPAMVDVPFYESKIWLYTVAILGLIVLVLTLANASLSIWIKVKRDLR